MNQVALLQQDALWSRHVNELLMVMIMMVKMKMVRMRMMMRKHNNWIDVYVTASMDNQLV